MAAIISEPWKSNRFVNEECRKLSESIDKINALIVTGKLTGGGIQNLILDMVRHQDLADCHYDVCTMADEPGELAPQVIENGSHVYNVNPRDGWRNFSIRFSQLLANRNYQAIHAIRSGSAMSLPITAAAKAGVPVRIAHYQNIFRPVNLSFFRRAITPLWRKSVIKDATHILAASSEVMESHFPDRDKSDDKYRVFPNAIDLESFSKIEAREVREEFGFEDDHIIIGNVARFSEAKNHRLIVDVAEKVCNECPHVRFLLTGDGPLHQSIRDYIHKKKLQNFVILTGWRDDIHRVLNAMDVFFFPSRWEGFGIALLEAEASGLPCVTSRLQAFDDVLAPQFREFTADCDDVDSFMNSLQKLITRSDLRKQLGDEARIHARKFGVESFMKKLSTCYHQGVSATK